MKCPLLILAYTYVPGPTVENVGDCLKEECAWWDIETEGCCILAIRECLSGIGEELNIIRGKMPTKG